MAQQGCTLTAAVCNAAEGLIGTSVKCVGVTRRHERIVRIEVPKTDSREAVTRSLSASFPHLSIRDAICALTGEGEIVVTIPTQHAFCSAFSSGHLASRVVAMGIHVLSLGCALLGLALWIRV